MGLRRAPSFLRVAAATVMVRKPQKLISDAIWQEPRPRFEIGIALGGLF
jgi:hypothetical protein